MGNSGLSKTSNIIAASLTGAPHEGRSGARDAGKRHGEPRLRWKTQSPKKKKETVGGHEKS